jgi:FixJ family two-component response regulator
VEAHRAKVMEKLEARSLSELMRMVMAIDQVGH